MTKSRFLFLDDIRGIAALTILSYHFLFFLFSCPTRLQLFFFQLRRRPKKAGKFTYYYMSRNSQCRESDLFVTVAKILRNVGFVPIPKLLVSSAR